MESLFLLKTLSIYIASAYTVIPLIHELGHAFAAKLAGVEVFFFGLGDSSPLFRIPFGGTLFYAARRGRVAGLTCIREEDASAGKKIFIYSGGLIAELVLLSAIAALFFFTTPRSLDWLAAFGLAWGAHFVFGLLPLKMEGGRATDMRAMLRLFGGKHGHESDVRSLERMLALARELGHAGAVEYLDNKIGSAPACDMDSEDIVKPTPAALVALNTFACAAVALTVAFNVYVIFTGYHTPWKLYVMKTFILHTVVLTALIILGGGAMIVLRRLGRDMRFALTCFFMLALGALFFFELPVRKYGPGEPYEAWMQVEFKAGKPYYWWTTDGRSLLEALDRSGDGLPDIMEKTLPGGESIRIVDEDFDGLFNGDFSSRNCSIIEALKEPRK